MKLLTTVILSIALMTGIFAGGEKPNTETKEDHAVALEEIAASDVADITIHAKGLVCAFCAQGVKKAFAEEGNVRGLRFNDDFNKIELFLRKGKEISNESIESIMTNAGYAVEKIES